MKISFKKFLEDMDPSMDKNLDASTGTSNDSSPEKEDYFDATGDELGIEWEDLSKALESEPWVSASFDLGGLGHKLSAWEIVKGSLTKDGADIRLKPQNHDRSYTDHGHRLNKSKYKDNKTYHLSRKELQQFLTSGWQPALAAAQSGGDMGMGGPDMGMGAPPI